MGGRIAVESEYGQGATFRFFIRSIAAQAPIISPSLPPSNVSTPTLSLGSPSDALDLDDSNAEFHVLITEDNIINQVCDSRFVQLSYY